MYRDLSITNFRGFRRFTMEGLGRINLLVGPNNCGKTTVLDAVLLLAEHPDPVAVGLKSIVRGGFVSVDGTQPLASSRIMLHPLFFGHTAKVGAQFEIEAHRADRLDRLTVCIADKPDQGSSSSPAVKPVLAGLPWLVMKREGPQEPVIHSVALNSNTEWVMGDWAERAELVKHRFEVQEISPASLQSETASQLLSKVVLNPEEQLVLKVLRIIEPRIEGITTVSLREPLPIPADRTGFYVKLKGHRGRIPLGSLGEGVWRLLALALSLVHARGTLLLVDEIDIGLHYSAQADMWRMVKQSAEELDVQVFATTHSRDCIEALAQIARPDVTQGSEVTIQRIEGERAVAYSEREIVLAAERHIEVR